MRDPIEIDAPDDTGSQTLARYEYQTHVAARSLLEMLSGGPVLHVTCEHIEDIVVARADGEGTVWDFLQVKSRDGATPWTHGGVLRAEPLKSLWRSHQDIRETVDRYRLTIGLEGVLSRTDPHILALARGEGGKEPKRLARVAKHLQADSGAVSAFLRKVRIQCLPTREVIALGNMEALGEIAGPDVTRGALRALYRDLLDLARTAALGELGPRLPRLLGFEEPGMLNPRKRIDETHLAPFHRSMASPDLQALVRASQGRMVHRWIASGMPPRLAKEFADDASVGTPTGSLASLPAHGTFVLEGDFGSGKSLLAERMHLADIDTALAVKRAPIPVYLRAKDVQGDLGAAAETAAHPIGDVHARGARIVLDGLDESGPARSEDLLLQARALTAVAPGWRVLATARPGLPLFDDERHTCPLLDDDQATALIERAGGKTRVLRVASEDVRDAIRRPLFALIAAGLSQNDEEIPTQPTGFLDALVTRAIRGADQLNSEVRQLLARLAIGTITGGGLVAAADVGGDTVQALLDTRLVIREGRCLAFALPVLEQYFAGQAVLCGAVPDTLLRDPESLGRLRHGLALAVSSSGWEQATALMSPLIASFPGAAAWALQEAVPAITAEAPSPHADDSTVTQRLNQAWDAWMDALAPASGHLFSFSPDQSVDLTVDARLDGRTLSAMLLKRRDDGSVPALDIPFALRYAEPRSSPHRPLGWFHGPVATDYGAWPWRWPLSPISNALGRACTHHSLAVTGCHPYDAERIWAIGKQLLNRSERDQAPLPVELVLRELRRRLVQNGPSAHHIFTRRLRSHSEELSRLGSELELGTWSGADGRIHRPYPTPDQEREERGWRSYSPSRFHLLTTQVLTAMLEIHSALVHQWLPRLAPTLNLAGLSHAGIDGTLLVSRASDHDQDPELHVRLVPRDQAYPVRLRLETAADFDTYVPEFTTGATAPIPLDRGSWNRSPTAVVRSEPKVLKDTPATDYAFAQLHRDLARLHLAKPPIWHDEL